MNEKCSFLAFLNGEISANFDISHAKFERRFFTFLYLWGFQVFAVADGAAVLLRARKFRLWFRVFCGRFLGAIKTETQGH